MTIYASVIDGVSYTAGPGWRYAFGSLLVPGVTGQPQSDLLTTAQSTPNMSVNVSAGSAWIQGNINTPQGMYSVLSDAAVTVDIPAASTSDARIDLICIVVTDPAQGQSGGAGASIIDVAGTPSSSPTPPAVPPNGLAIAQISVPVSATSITSSDITNLSPYAATSVPSAPAQWTGGAPQNGFYQVGMSIVDGAGRQWVCIGVDSNGESVWVYASGGQAVLTGILNTAVTLTSGTVATPTSFTVVGGGGDVTIDASTGVINMYFSGLYRVTIGGMATGWLTQIDSTESATLALFATYANGPNAGQVAVMGHSFATGANSGAMVLNATASGIIQTTEYNQEIQLQALFNINNNTTGTATLQAPGVADIGQTFAQPTFITVEALQIVVNTAPLT